MVKYSQKSTKKVKKSIPHGQVYIQSSFNNTLVTITDLEGNTIAWSSAGSNGFKGSRKSTPYAGQVAAENAAEKAKIDVYVKGVGPSREQSVRGLQAAGIQVLSLTDITPIAHNGARAKKPRRN